MACNEFDVDDVDICRRLKLCQTMLQLVPTSRIHKRQVAEKLLETHVSARLKLMIGVQEHAALGKSFPPDGISVVAVDVWGRNRWPSGFKALFDFLFA